jgi:hypothetical protein
MKTKFALIIALIFSSALSYGQTREEIISKYLDAIGGKANWDKLKTVKMTGNIDIGPNMKAPFTLYLKDKTKSRFELEFQGMKMIQALDGDSGWKVVPFQGKLDPERMSPEEVKDGKTQADFTGDLYNWKEKGSQVELLGKEDMEGTECYKLKVTKKDGDVTYIFLDATTYLPLKESRKIKMQDKEMETASVPSNYKKVGAYTFPFTIEMRGGEEAAQGQALNIETVEVNVPIAEDLFKMPAMKSAVDPAQTK